MISKLKLELRRVIFQGLLGYLSLYPHRLGVLLFRHVLRRRYYTRNLQGFRMKFDLHDGGISSVLATAGTREEETIAILDKELRPGMTVFDLGANIGVYGLFMAKAVGDQGFVLSVEPGEDNFNLLISNIALNNLQHRFDTQQIAISNRTGEGILYVHEQANLHTLTNFTTKERDSIVDEIRIPVMSLRDFVFCKSEAHPSLDLIRMDIEGHEVEVLESLSDVVLEFGIHPLVLFENHFPKYQDNPGRMRKNLENLFELGYYVKAMASTDERLSHLRVIGYSPSEVVKASMRQRGIYEGVSKEDALDVICDIGTIRTTLLAWRG